MIHEKKPEQKILWHCSFKFRQCLKKKLYDIPLMQKENRKISMTDHMQEQSRRFSLDLTPRLLYARGEMVELLISSNIARQIPSPPKYIYTTVSAPRRNGDPPPSRTSSPASECATLKQGGAHLPAGEGKSQFGRLEKKPRTPLQCNTRA